jgi:hypothetical protein
VALERNRVKTRQVLARETDRGLIAKVSKKQPAGLISS